jgi:N-acetylglucosaminyl-diphospho-decaprenol L-rhamnosyltransferase
MICLSVVSHGQLSLATEFLRCIARIRPAQLSHIIYTRNIAEGDLPDLDLGHIGLTVVTNDQVQGFGTNHNAAFAHCRQPIFCVCNPDIVLESDPFPALVEAFRDEHVGLVAPLVMSPQGAVENTSRALYTPFEVLAQKLRPANRAARADWLAGMFLLFRSEAYRTISGFDSGYFLYIEDVDICTRLRLAGWTLRQVPEARVIHNARKQSHRSPGHTRWHLAGMSRYWLSRSFWRYRALLRRERRATRAVSSR